MKEFFKSTKFKIVAFLLAFLIGFMVFALTKGGYSLSTVSFINTITSPFKTLSNNISNKVVNYLDKVNNATEYFNENQRLRDEIGQLKLQISEYDNLQQELDELKKFVGIKEDNPDFIISKPCDIIGYTTNDPFMSFTINIGENDGIKPYQPVVNSDGIVGITIEVSANTSTVRTLISPDLAIAVVCKETSSSAVLEGFISEDGAGARLIHLTSDSTFKVGDELVTATSNKFFPAGYPVGKITKVETKDGLEYTATIQTFAAIDRLNSVVVITDFSGKDSSDASKNS